MSQQGTALAPFCPNCGKNVAADDKFCRACGKALEPTVASAASSDAASNSAPLQQKQSDPMLAVRVVLLIGAAISFFAFPMFVTLLLVLAWIIVMVWPQKKPGN